MPGTVYVCLLFLCFPPPEATATVVDSYAQRCQVYSISKKDTAITQRNLSRENARCRSARGEKK